MRDGYKEITSQIGRVTDIPEIHQKPRSLGWALGGNEKNLFGYLLFLMMQKVV